MNETQPERSETTGMKTKTVPAAKPEMISAEGMKSTETLLKDRGLQELTLSTVNCIWDAKDGTGKVTARAPVRFDRYVVGHCPERTSVGIKVTTYGDGLKMVRTADAFPKLTPTVIAGEWNVIASGLEGDKWVSQVYVFTSVDRWYMCGAVRHFIITGSRDALAATGSVKADFAQWLNDTYYNGGSIR